MKIKLKPLFTENGALVCSLVSCVIVDFLATIKLIYTENPKKEKCLEPISNCHQTLQHHFCMWFREMFALVSMLMNMQCGNLIFVYLYFMSLLSAVTSTCLNLVHTRSQIISVVSRSFVVFVMKVASQVSEECVNIYFVYCCLLLKQKKGIFSLSYYDS